VDARTSDLREAKEAADIPVLANTGVKHETIEEVLSIADGAIVGTSLKVDGHTWNPVDPERVRDMMRRVRDVRESLAAA
jgi:predicted TIM-barrel enzyme